jgi:integrase
MARRPKPAPDQNNLRLNNGFWQVRFKLPEELGGKRLEISTCTADLATAVAIRDRIMIPLRMQGASSEIARAVLAQAHQSDSLSRMLLDRAREELQINTATGPTIKEASARFLENRRVFKLRTGHTVYDYTRTLEAFVEVVGDLMVSQVTKQHVRDFRDKLMVMGRYWSRGGKIDKGTAAEADRLSPKTVHKMVKNLSTFLNWCLKEDIIDRNPALGIDLPTVPRNQTQPPPPELADALCRLPPLQRASQVGILEWEVLPWFYRYTGARCGEIAQLRKRDVVTVDGVLCFMVTTEKVSMRKARNQTDPQRLVPVHPQLKPILDRVLEARKDAGPDDPLFPNAGNYFVESIQETRYGHGWSNHYNDHAKKIWPQMHVHAWRSYVITEMARRGIPEEVRRKVVGHVPRDVHAGYNHVDVKRLVEAVNAIP